MSNYDPNQPSQPYNPDAYGQNPPSYGQNPYGENPYGQNPNPYGQQPFEQQPSYNPYPPQGGYTPVQPPAQRPSTLNLAFWLILASGVVSSIATWVMFNSNMFANMLTSQWAMVQQQLQAELENSPELANDPMLSQMMASPEAFLAQFNQMVSGVLIVSLIISLALYFIVGFTVGRGVAAMRIIATILAIFSVVGLFSNVAMVSAFGDTQAGIINALTVIGVLLGIAGVVFSWLRPSSEYIMARRQARRAGYR